MEQIKEFNKQNLNVIRNLIEIKFAEIEKDTGIKLTMKNIRYSSDTFHSKIEAVLKEKAEKLADPKANWNESCIFFGLKPEDYKPIFKIHGTDYEFVKFDLKKRKYPVILKSIITQKKFKFPENTLFLNK